MRHIQSFDRFLNHVVNLNHTRLAQLDGRVKAITAVIENDEELGPRLKSTVPQGSWAHQTIIRPVGDREFDADFLVLLEEELAWSANPGEYLRQLRAALKRSKTYQDKVRKKNRCVRVGYANDCHVDVVPSIVLEDGRHVIINYAANCFEQTNPEGFTEWMKEKDALAQDNLRRVIRLVKFLRDIKLTFSCPSVILTALLGERIQVFDELRRYADVPTTLMNVLKDLDTWLGLYATMPVIVDPSCPGTSFNHRWSEDKYQNFKAKIKYYSQKVELAYNEEDQRKSLAAWQSIFGDEFVLVENFEETKVMSAFESIAKAPDEEFVQDRFTFQGGHQARIDCSVLTKGGLPAGSLRQLRTVGKYRKLLFEVSTDVPEPFELWWKVRNRGSEATHLAALRGQLLLDEGNRKREESTAYTGKHFVEAYVVKNGRVVASDHHVVEVR